MKTIDYLISTCVVLLAISSTAFAADYAHFHFIGFSRAGTYLAFEEYGMNDDVDDSSPYSVIYIVNVKQNTLAFSPIRSSGPYDVNGEWDAVETAVRDRNLRRAKSRLKQFGIIEGNTGLQVVAHLVNEYPLGEQTALLPQNDGQPDGSKDNANTASANENANVAVNSNSNSTLSNTAGSNTGPRAEPQEEKKKDPLEGYLSFLPQEVAFTKSGNTLYRVGYFELKIKPVPVTQKNCDEYERDMFSFEMTLKNERDETKLLQKAGKVPKGRGCVDGYGIQEAFIYHGKLAVFVGIFTRGWEGENLRLMAVTGELND